MKGFNPKWKDFPDYIIGVTKEIWEDRGVHTLKHYYASDIIVRSPASVVQGNEGVIAATMSTLAELPDRQLFGEDVIWTGTPEQGMLSSHRLLCTATHSTLVPMGNRRVSKLNIESWRIATPSMTKSMMSGWLEIRGRLHYSLVKLRWNTLESSLS